MTNTKTGSKIIERETSINILLSNTNDQEEVVRYVDSFREKGLEVAYSITSLDDMRGMGMFERFLYVEIDKVWYVDIEVFIEFLEGLTVLSGRWIDY